MNFLNIQFRFEGVFITTNTYAAYDASADTWAKNQIAKVPEYTTADLIDYKTGCWTMTWRLSSLAEMKIEAWLGDDNRH